MIQATMQQGGKVYIPKMVMVSIEIVIRGISDLLCSNWRTKHGEIRNCRIDPKVFGKMTPDEQFKQALCPVDGREKWSERKHGKYGMPGYYVKLACTRTAHEVKDWDLRDLIRAAVHVPEDVVPVTKVFPKPYTSEVNIATRGRGREMIEKTRAIFPKGWEMVVKADLDQGLLRPDDLASIVDRAGRAIGIGEWRPERGGQFGAFELVEIRA